MIVKKSEAFKMAQYSVMADELIESAEKLEILRILMEAEDIAKYGEKKEAEDKE